MFWNVTFIYNAFIRTRDHCKVQTNFLRIFLISENSLKFANFFAEVTNSRSMCVLFCNVFPHNCC